MVHERALPPRESAIAGSLDLSSVLDTGAGRGYLVIYSYSVLSFSPRLSLCSLAYIVVMFARVESQSQPGLDDSEHNGMMPAAGREMHGSLAFEKPGKVGIVQHLPDLLLVLGCLADLTTIQLTDFGWWGDVHWDFKGFQHHPKWSVLT